MARGNDLATALFGGLGQQPVYLALAQNLQVRIGFVQKQDIAGIGVEIGQDQQRLLQSPPAGREVEPDAAFPVGHLDLATLLHIARFFE